MNGLILINAYYSAPPYVHQYNRIAEELRNAGVHCEVRRNDFFPAVINGGNIESKLSGKLNGTLNDFDFCVYLDKDKYASEMLEKSGLRLFNTHAAITACDDKMLTFMRLSGQGIPMPRTLPAPLCYTDTATVKPETANLIEQALGYPLIVKMSHGSMGKGVFKADNRGELLSLMNAHKLAPHLYQEFVTASSGRDLRVMVVGGKALGGMLRKSESGFLSNVGAGGQGERYSLTPETAELCEKISALLGLDFCGIDLLFTADGFTVCEVNSNAFFEAFESVTGINVAKAYARHIVSELTISY